MRIRIWLALLSIYIIWGSTYLGIRFAVETIPPFLMAATRFLTAGAILFVWTRLAGNPLPSLEEVKAASIMGLFLLLGGNGLVSWAEQHVPSGVTALIVAASPLWMVLIDLLLPGVRSRLNGLMAAGVFMGFLGVVLLLLRGDLLGGSGLDLTGSIALLAATLLWAGGSIYGRGAPTPQSPLMGASLEMLAGGSGLFLVGTLTGEWSRLNLAGISTRSLLSLLYLILFGALVAFSAYSWLLRVAPTPLVATYAYVNPLIAILIGNLLAGEVLTLRILLSAIIIISAVAIINWGRMQLHVQVPLQVPAAED
ncbi:MAG: EamA family transporter [Candidatus Villigracilaceae bacterium]